VSKKHGLSKEERVEVMAFAARSQLDEKDK